VPVLALRFVSLAAAAPALHRAGRFSPEGAGASVCLVGLLQRRPCTAPEGSHRKVLTGGFSPEGAGARVDDGDVYLQGAKLEQNVATSFRVTCRCRCWLLLLCPSSSPHHGAPGHIQRLEGVRVEAAKQERHSGGQLSCLEAWPGSCCVIAIYVTFEPSV
jgi:hypothetical protein